LHWKETLPEWYVKEYGYQPCVNIGTAGHVDHGKTTLVEAITGVWTSAHSEELRRGITIKIGYADAAFYKCPHCPTPICYSTEPKCSNCGENSELLRVVSFVDSPGHESLMANMLSGAALMDGALLVMAANEKVPQPQTREHLLALSVLGIQQIVLVQNKADLSEYQEALDNYKQIKEFVKGSIAEKAPVIPVSAQHKLNIDALIEAIEKTIKTPERTKNSDPIMHVLRSFDINKPGSPINQVKGGIIGGALVQGQFNIDDEIEIRPGVLDEKRGRYQPITSQISTLGTGAGLVESVKPGGLVAIGTRLDPTFTKSDSLIGSVVGKPGTLPKDVEDITMEIVLFETAVGTAEMVRVEPLKAKEPIRVNMGTAAAIGNVTNVKDSSKIEVKLKKPVCFMPKSRVAISRRIAERWRLIGSGIAE
jgi:translation initiation factor 2 subunit 3